MPGDIIFSSLHNYLDPASGAAISTRAVLKKLARDGWRVRVFCGTAFDGNDATSARFRALLRSTGREWREETYDYAFRGRARRFRLLKGFDDGIEATFLLLGDRYDFSFSVLFSEELGELYARALGRELTADPPMIYASYGGYRAARSAALRAREVGATTVFLLHNLNYTDASLFAAFDRVVVPSEFARAAYRRRLNLETIALAPIIDENAVVASSYDRRFATVVNPTPEKGLYFAVGLARELEARRRDIPFLFVETRGRVDALAAIPEARALKRLYSSGRVDPPSAIYGKTRVLIAPSLCEESFGRVVVEAAMNGVPIVCSDRGAFPEVMSAGGARRPFALSIPERFTPQTRVVPSSREVAPWADAVELLWDRAEDANALDESLLRVARRYRQEETERATSRFFESLLPASGRSRAK